MDDGYKDGNSFRIATESFTESEVLLLINVLKTKFDLDCSINTLVFRETVRPAKLLITMW
ncbi:hypothetical protein BC936DRAFT_140590 [Jimgerdemannia flammicorona]|uniref:Homing endonuclease LAGLIDADG domain-containing protein n=1 Tax=Jimgerdemannia flammicorona TaxID=994334 RepID=A0A433DMT7_9FUNG|nr:hypothetical protein BC936DRAFT_140590 [Jimgerdemannia flammicorona]